MKRARTILSLIAIGTMVTFANGQPLQPHRSPHQRLTAPPITDIHVADAFWAPRIATCRKVTLPYCFDTCEKTERILNFDRAAGVAPGKFAGIWFNDSDVYKVLEGAAYTLATGPDDRLDKLTDKTIARIAAAQQPDGYLYCFFTIDNVDQRFKNIQPTARHELYCMGHLIEAAATHFELTGKRNLLDVGCKLADHVGSVFGPGKRQEVPEHQSIESGLIKLYRVTGQQRYLELARFFIDQRGNAAGHKLYGAYSQDHEPACKQREIVGHAVRAMYNCTAMADAYLESGDRELLTACRRLWRNTTQQKMYLTGGVGATRAGEAFGADYELPNATAYAETCAAIGLIFFAHRMLLIEPDAQYADVLERVLYNGFLSSVSLEGDKFFYQNRLATRGDYRRQAWYGCACCPSNIVRIFPKIGRYIYAHDDRAIYVNLYIAGSGKMKLGETDVAITQLTRYPWDGNVKLVVHPAAEKQFELCLRIPGWCTDLQTPGGLYRVADRSFRSGWGRTASSEQGAPRSSATGGSSLAARDSTPATLAAKVVERDLPERWVTVKVNGESINTGHRQQGYVRIDRKWKRGDVVELDLPMPIRRMRAHSKVEADAGRVALQRGPIVYCVEAVDHDVDIRHLSLPADAELKAEHRPDFLGGVSVITGEGTVREVDSGELKSARLLAVPYYAWDNREGGAMAVWLPEDPKLAMPVPRPTIASNARASASHCWTRDSVEALNSQIEPPHSHDLSVPRHTWWDHRGTKEWVQYDFAAPQKVSATEVYWFDDHKTGHCRVPESWKLLCKDGEAWKPVGGASAYLIEQDKYNRVTFDPVETTALRIEVQLRKDCSGGILQWRVHGVGQGSP